MLFGTASALRMFMTVAVGMEPGKAIQTGGISVAGQNPGSAKGSAGEWRNVWLGTTSENSSVNSGGEHSQIYWQSMLRAPGMGQRTSTATYSGEASGRGEIGTQDEKEESTPGEQASLAPESGETAWRSRIAAADENDPVTPAGNQTPANAQISMGTGGVGREAQSQ